ncbi:MAG: cation:proton antiporter subunit C [Hyphomonas sp.]|uniref:cation:proton antiporter subunit C n=1 Tax=Hyphomonas sp. TaxID=87 RepID=UPI003002D8A9|tara:strand:- start:68 stop:571 length:504 start_codon:yes stop_codon:yes gene_type:complete
MLEFILERANYWAIIGLMMIGLYITFASGNLIKRLVGLSLFQTSVCLFYVTLGKVAGGTAPILYGEDAVEHGAEAAHHATGVAGGHALGNASAPVELVHTYSNVLPHVLMLTAIVVGVATLSVGLALIVRIREAYGSIESDEVREIDLETALAQEAEIDQWLNEAGA